MHEAQERILCERQWGRLLPACHPASSERRWAWDPERVGVVPVLRAAELGSEVYGKTLTNDDVETIADIIYAGSRRPSPERMWKHPPPMSMQT